MYDVKFIFSLQLMSNYVPMSCMDLGCCVKDGDLTDADYGKSLSLSSHIRKCGGAQVPLALPLAQYCPGSGRNFSMSSHHPGDHAQSSMRSPVSSAA